MKLKNMEFRGNYQIDDLKKGISLESAMEIVGEIEVNVIETEESGDYYCITYIYDNYRGELQNMCYNYLKGLCNIMIHVI